MTAASDAVLERAITLGWSSFKGSWPLLLVAVLAMSMGGVPGTMVSQITQAVSGVLRSTGLSPSEAGVVTVVGVTLGQAIGFLVQWPLSAGAVAAALRAQRGQANDFRSLLEGFRRFPSVVAVQSILLVMSSVLWTPLAVLAWPAFSGIVLEGAAAPDFERLNVGGLVLAGLLVMALQFWLGARFGQAVARVADPDEPKIGGLAALRYSFELTRGHTLTAIGMTILTSTVTVLGLLLCCIGVLLVGMPLALALQVGFYRALRREPDPVPVAHVPWLGSVPPQTPV